MSDELVKNLNERINELKKEKEDLNVAIKTERKQRRDLKTQLDELLSRSDVDLKARDLERAELTAKLE